MGVIFRDMNRTANLRRSDRSHVDQDTDGGLARVAGAIGEPARARMLCCLMDGHARTGTELAIAAEVGASTASVHLQKLMAARLVKVAAQGKHRYYSFAGAECRAGAGRVERGGGRGFTAQQI
jgi:DNA-binding transcriptional ArsR family regulator